MTNLRFLYDEPQEASWFRDLDSRLSNIPMARIGDTDESSKVRRVLSYDRPDIVLIDGEQPILSIEETIEVPSGHNVGQRFARLAAASEVAVPALYFGPYVAKKHGGKTAGPRYVNLRLFKALDRMIEITGSAVITLNWPVDENFEMAIQLEEQLTELDDVEVTALKNPMTTVNGNLKIDVQNAVFASMVNPLEVLSKVPNIQISPDRESISVISRGSPLIYLGNQRIGLEEFKGLFAQIDI